jgi:aspartyl-tRNA(Asn)/glutamyl-tRNA(Gln) amidotransferase subunit A
MSQQEIVRLTIAELSRRIRSREVSPVEVVNASLARIDGMDPILNTHITVCHDEARQAATVAEREILQGNYLGPLHGVPLGLKDIIATNGVRTTCGSNLFADWVPDYDATVASRLKAAGAVIIGKDHCYEFAIAPPNPMFGFTRNPWNTDYDPAGSSSGTAAAVAAYLEFGGIGTDTGGSIRLPASVCGVVGLKPTYGRVSRHGIFPLSWSMDHAGPLTRSVEDAAIVLQAIAGPDSKDLSTASVPVPDYSLALKRDVKGLRVGLPRNYFFDGVGQEIQDAIRKAARVLEGAGMEVVEVSIPYAEYIVPAWLGVMSVEAAAVHQAYLRTRATEYVRNVLDIVLPGNFLPAATHMKAEKARRMITQSFKDLLKQVDVLITPASPVVAWTPGRLRQFGPRAVDVVAKLSQCACPFNLTGLPSISVPCGMGSEGIPIGMLISGRAYDEETVLRVAYTYEESSLDNQPFTRT